MNFFHRKGNPRFRGLASCLAITLLLASLPSCKKEYFELDRVKDGTWNPELAVPLIKSSITVPEVLSRLDDQEIITIDPNTGLLALKYFSTVFSVQAKDWLLLPALNVNAPAPVDASTSLAYTQFGQATMQPITVPVTFQGPNGEELSEVDFQNGTFEVRVTNNTTAPVNVSLAIPSLQLAGVGYSSGTISVGAGGSTTSTTNLSSYVLTLGTGSSFNMNATVAFTPGGALAIGQVVDIVVRMSGPNASGGATFNEIRGDFQQQAIDVPRDSVRLKLFENETGGTIQWDSAIVRGTFFNTFGMDLFANLPVFDVQNTGTGQILSVTGLPSNFTIPTGTPAYQPGVYSFEMVGQQAGANINAVMNLNPDRLIYDGDVTANPGAGPYNNFMRDTSKLQLDVDAILPFFGRAFNFTRQDSADVDIFPLDGDVEEIVSVTLRLTLDNGFPANAFAQVYLCDTTGTDTIQALFPTPVKQLFASGTPNGNFEIDQTNKPRTVTDITLTRDQLQVLEQRGFGRVKIYGWLETFQAGAVPVKVFENYTLDMWLGMMVEAKVKIDF